MSIAIKVVPAEERAAAEMIADEIVAGWEADLPWPLIERLREKVVHDILWPVRGREQLAKARGTAVS